MCKILLQITINRWSFTTDFDDRKHLEPQLKEKVLFPHKRSYNVITYTQLYFEFCSLKTLYQLFYHKA